MTLALEKTWQHKQNFALDNSSALNLGRDMMRQLKKALLGEGSWTNQSGGSITPTGVWTMQRSSDGTNVGTDVTQATGTITISSGSGPVGATINGVLVTVIWATSDIATATALDAAIDASSANVYVTASSTGTNVVTLTAKNPGYVGTAGNSITNVASGTGVTTSGTLTGGVNPDGVDQLGDTLTEYVQAATGTAHAWYILRSATASYNGYYAYLTVDLTATNQYGIHLSRTFPTGGSVTTAPIASDAISFLAGQYWEGATTNAHNFHCAMATDGSFWAGLSKTASGVMSYLTFVTDFAEAKSADLFPACLGATYASTGVFFLDLTSAVNNFAYTLNSVLKGRNAANTAANVLTFASVGNNNGPLGGATLNLADAVDGTDNVFSIWCVGITQATKKGRVKDFLLAVRARADGSNYPATGTTLFATIGDGAFPANVALTL